MRYPLITYTFLAVNLTIHAITAHAQTVDVTLGKAESFSQSLYTFNTDMATVIFASLVEHRDAIEIATPLDLRLRV